MKRSHGQKGFTLVEIIVTLVILGVLAAIMVPAMTGWIRHAQAKACLAELGGVCRSYQAEAALMMYRVEEPAPLLARAAGEWGGEGRSDKAIICPCGNPGTVSYSADNAAITGITCSVHGSLLNPGGSLATMLASMWTDASVDNDGKANTANQSLADYFKRSGNATLDSEGGNWGKKITLLMKDKGVDVSDSLWRIKRQDAKQPDVYEISWAEAGSTELERGTEVTVTRVNYNAKTGAITELEPATRWVSTKTEEGGAPYLILSDFKPK